jgi:PAS domain S-box-containing protein
MATGQTLLVGETQRESHYGLRVPAGLLYENLTRQPALLCDVPECGLCYPKPMFDDNTKPRWVVDLKTREVLDCNQSAALLWGYMPEEMIGIPAERLLHVNEIERAREVRNEHLSGDMGTWMCVRKDGSVFHTRIEVRRGVVNGRLCAVGIAI